MPFPKKPRLISECGRWEIVPEVQTLKISRLRARTEDEKADYAKLGPFYRIMYSVKMYDVAMQEARDMIAKGQPEDRIEYVLARRDLAQAVEEGKFGVVVLKTGEEKA